MKNKLIYFFLFYSTLSFGQNIFEIKKGSKIYNAKMTVNCEGGNCSGKGTITLAKKMPKKLLKL